MKILVIGGSGLIGSHVLRAASAACHTSAGTYRRLPLPGLIPLDGADETAFPAILHAQKPDAVVYTAGFTWVDGCEDDPLAARDANAHQPERLARQCSERGIHFTYLSTSYVFDGKAGPYAEDATPNPLNVYARTKWEGEQRVQAACEGAALIPRVVWVYGAEAQRKNFACQVWQALVEGKSLRVPSDQCGNPTYAGDIARWLLALLERRANGVWHLAGPLPDCTRPQWLDLLVGAFTTAGVVRHPAFTFEAVPTAVLGQRALRPLRAGMHTQKLAALQLPPTGFSETIRMMVREQQAFYLPDR